MVSTAYLQSLIDMIEVDDAQIRIKGSKELLERTVLASRNGVHSGFADEYWLALPRGIEPLFQP
jgi:hypothetical protein